MVGVLLPVYMSVRALQLSTLPQPPPLLSAGASSWEQLQHSAQHAYAAANLAVWRTFSLPQSGLLPRGLVLWLVVALSWTLTLALHGL